MECEAVAAKGPGGLGAGWRWGHIFSLRAFTPAAPPPTHETRVLEQLRCIGALVSLLAAHAIRTEPILWFGYCW